jgi:mRNA-degrading endonuclease RelE of RelBE toxin-antitoxin system
MGMILKNEDGLSPPLTWFQFVEAPAFTRFRGNYLDDDAFAELQRYLAKNPEAGERVPGAGGIRKLRWKDPRRGKGKRGGLRIIYYCFLSEQQIWLLTLYDKNEAADLTKDEREVLRRALEAERAARKVGNKE